MLNKILNLSWLIWVIPSILAISIFAYLKFEFQLDDALIYMRYVQNLYYGHELSYNLGEKFNGLTSPLYTLISVLVGLISKNFQLNSVIISSAFLLLTIVFTINTFFQNTPLYFKITIGLLFSNFSFFYNTYGMESTLYVFLISWLCLLSKRQSEYLFVICALLIHTRSESIILFLPIMIYYFYRTRRIPSAKILAASITIFLIPLLFNYGYYGSFAAETASAKMGQAQSQIWSKKFGFLKIDFMLPMFFNSSFSSVIAFLSLAILGLLKLFKDIEFKLCFFALMALTIILAILNIPYYSWYYAAHMYGMMISLAAGLLYLLNIIQKFGWNRIPLYLIAFSFLSFLSFHMSAVHNRDHPHMDYKKIGEWMGQNLPADASLATIEIGTIGWYSKMHIVDILGLVTPHNADYIAQRKLHNWLLHYQPEYILAHDPYWKDLEDSVKFLENEGLYKSEETFDVKGYKLLKRQVEEDEVRNAITEKKFLKYCDQTSKDYYCN